MRTRILVPERTRMRGPGMVGALPFAPNAATTSACPAGPGRGTSVRGAPRASATGCCLAAARPPPGCHWAGYAGSRRDRSQPPLRGGGRRRVTGASVEDPWGERQAKAGGGGADGASPHVGPVRYLPAGPPARAPEALMSFTAGSRVAAALSRRVVHCPATRRPGDGAAGPPAGRHRAPRRTCASRRAGRVRATGSSAPTTASTRRSIPVTETLRGSERITYRNNAPESLPHLWMHVEQNICAKESLTNQLNQPPLVFLSTAFDFSCQGFDGGLVLESVKVNGTDAKYLVTGTTMRVDLARPLPRAARSASTSCGASACRPTARAAWVMTARSTSWASGTRAWRCMTT